MNNPKQIHSTPVAWYTRAWLVMEVVFGVLAILSIALFPADTETNFAWPIQPVVMASMLGGFYLATSILLILALFTRRWENMRLVVLPAVAFTTIELVATFLHWDKFSVGTVPFYVWFASYLLPPPIFLAVYILQQGKAAPRIFNPPLPAVLRWFLIVLGGLFMVEALITLVYPAYLTASFPWTLTPLTARVLGGWLASAGGVMLAVAYENDRTRTRIAGPYFAALLPALALQIGRYAYEVDFSHPRVYIWAVLLISLFVVGLYLSRGNWRETLG
jgi:hypothetical protein